MEHNEGSKRFSKDFQFYNNFDGAITFSTTTLSIMTLCLLALGKKTLGIIALGRKTLGTTTIGIVIFT